MPQRLFDHDDFEATVLIFTHEQGGRASPTFNGIRWDLCYAEDDVQDGIFMIHPDFVDTAGQSLSTDAPLPISIPLIARFRICNIKMVPKHQSRVRVGTEFFCHEGGRRVASGTVTRILDLHTERGG